MEVVYQILRYLKGTPSKGLWVRANQHLNLEGYYDAVGVLPSDSPRGILRRVVMSRDSSRLERDGARNTRI